MTTNPLCDRCGNHVGIGIYDDNWAFTPKQDRKPVQNICLWCTSGVSPAYVGSPLEAEVQKQREADLKAGLKPREYPGREGFRTEPRGHSSQQRSSRRR